jgi:hypothetical protein
MRVLISSMGCSIKESIDEWDTGSWSLAEKNRSLGIGL